jgi:hypothetical protein
MFQSCKAKSVTIPSSVTRIRSHAFSGSQIESISIPKDCIIEGGTGDLMSAFQDCSKLKTVTFPSGRVYFAARPIDPNNNWMWSGEGVFRECNSLVSIVIPKGFEAVYISESDFADHTLVEYFSGEKIKTSAATLKTLKSVKVRNAALVDHEAYLAAYNQAFKSGDYTRAQFLAKQFMENYSYYKSAEWTKRYTDIAEKKYLDDYNKAVASKDLQKAKKIINDFRGKISSDSSLSSLESKWDDMLFDVDCKMYLPAYVEKLEKKGSVVYLNSSLQFKIPLTEDVYENPRFNFTDSDGNGLWNTGYTLFLKKIKEFTGKDYQIYDSYSNPYLYRNATAEEVTKYNQVRKDAVKYFMDRALNVAVIEKDGSNSLLKIYLADDTYSYGNDSFYMIDSSGNKYTLSDKDFLAYAKEVCGTEYKLHGYYSGSYLYRNATDEEIAAYNQVRKDAVKYFMEETVKNAVVEKGSSNYVFKIYLSKEAYSYNNDTFTVKDASGTVYTVSDKDFLVYAKEVCGTEYNLYGRGSYLYRNATSEEIAADNQPRKDAVKYFMDVAEKKGRVEKDGSNLLFKIYLSESTYNYNKDTFSVKDSSGNVYTVSSNDFLDYAKEAGGIEYKLYATSRNPYLYATTNDMLNFKYNFALQNGSLHTNLACKLKDGWACAVEFEESKGVVSVKSFKVKKSVFENNGLAQKDVLKKIVMSDASGTETEVSREDLLKIPALCTLTFTVERGKGKKAKTFIVRIPVEWNMDEMKNVKDIVDFKCLMAFTSGKLHTNLACAVDKKWMCVAEFAEANNGVIIKSFRSKKSALEKNGLKTKDVIKSIVMTDGAGTETELGLSDLLKVRAPCTVTFTVERGSGKKVQLVTVSVPVEWNPEELGNIW